MSTARWFSVKTLYRWLVVGRPLNSDGDYDPDSALLEERVVLVRARSADQAITRAEREADKYASFTATNVYGQKIWIEYLGSCESFELVDEPGHGSEVFSSTDLINKKTPIKKLVDARLGKEEAANARQRRRKFNQLRFRDVDSQD